MANDLDYSKLMSDLTAGTPTEFDPQSTDQGDSEDTSDILSGNILDEFEGNEPSQDTEPAVDTKPDSTPESKQVVEGDEEVVEIDGKEVKINYKDKDSIKETFRKVKSFEKGMRKFQTERDSERIKNKELSEKLAERDRLWSKIEEASSSNDFNTLFKIMTAGRMDFDSFLSQQMERAELRRNATPEEIAQLDKNDELESVKRKLAEKEAKVDEILKKFSEKEEIAQVKELETKINPSFIKHRFAGKIGDKDAEQQLDEMLWSKVLTKLESYEEADLTPENIEQEFKQTASIINKVINKKAQDEVKATTETRKKQAKEAAAIQQVRGNVGSDMKKEMAKRVREGDLTGILSNWGTFGGLFK